MKRSMVVDLVKLARKYPTEVRELLGAIELDKTLALVRRNLAKARGEDGRARRPSFNGVPGVPAWKVARRLGLRTPAVFLHAHLADVDYRRHVDGSLYFEPAGVERMVRAERAKRASRR